MFIKNQLWLKQMQVFEVKQVFFHGSIDVSELPNGVYFIRAFRKKQAVTWIIIKSAP